MFCSKRVRSLSFILVYKQVSVFLKNFSKVTRFRLASSLASFNTTNALYMEISRQLMTGPEGNSEFFNIQNCHLLTFSLLIEIFQPHS